MQLIINGEPKKVQIASLPTIVEQEGLEAHTIVIAVNGEHIPRAQWSDFVLQEHDVIDMIAAIVGG